MTSIRGSACPECESDLVKQAVKSFSWLHYVNLIWETFYIHWYKILKLSLNLPRQTSPTRPFAPVGVVRLWSPIERFLLSFEVRPFGANRTLGAVKERIIVHSLGRGSGSRWIGIIWCGPFAVSISPYLCAMRLADFCNTSGWRDTERLKDAASKGLAWAPSTQVVSRFPP